jgi:hypothetical protein
MAKVCVEFDAGNGECPEPGIRTYSQTIGDGSSTVFTIPHGFGSADVLYAVRDLATNEVDSYDVSGVSQPNVLTLTFGSPVAVGGARVTVLSLATEA